ncbi:MAG: Gfo/Idh/MocA family oxidoreductase [Proteobacteria bacterium]|nr:Gfo/Idh/MocA family oxidoreductase [Pseudomonadota bacterium]MDA0993657.1 Gfo/Idh/MocA family oxidoreductase [Pseudomonadota bacterium]
MTEDNKKPDNPERRTFLRKAGLLPAGLYLQASTLTSAQEETAIGRPVADRASMAGHASPVLKTVRVGVIGAGRRGDTILRLLGGLDGVEIKAICDPYQPAIDSAKQLFAELGVATPVMYDNGDYAFRDMLARDDIDAVFVLTPWSWHTPMAVETMLAGKHAFVEVPAALTLDECWELVETSENTRMNCMMMENVCYGREELMALNMVRQGVLGELLHGEAAYIHELRWQMKDIEEGTGSWRTAWHTRRNANLYPTHGLGPIAQYMNINRGDRFNYLTSMSSPALGRQLYAKREFPPEHQRNQVSYITGDMNTSIIKTARGRTIMLQHDTTTPRPYTRHNLIQGTNGVFAGYPDRYALESEGDFHEWHTDISALQARYENPLWQKLASDATASIGHGGMDYVMLWRIVYCLRNSVPLDQNVYDAAAWSAVIPLSEASNADRGNSRDFPDFTRGAWQTTPPLEVSEYRT